MAEVTLDQFKSSLEDALTVLRRLGPHCRDVDEMAGLIELAVGPDGQQPGNAAQLKILKDLILPPQQQRQR